MKPKSLCVPRLGLFEDVSGRYRRQNVGKALRYSWKCLMLGLQNFTVGYSTPLSAAASIVPDFHPGGAWG
ncbi:hypothetical protein cypCar_00009063 [Cyprinus carpio]|nr:hypothetical protein cypCar_00009063 [Cyprinus carpio]